RASGHGARCLPVGASASLPWSAPSLDTWVGGGSDDLFPGELRVMFDTPRISGCRAPATAPGSSARRPARPLPPAVVAQPLTKRSSARREGSAPLPDRAAVL